MRPLRRMTAAAALLAAAVVRAEPRPERGYGLPHDASLDGHRVDWLIHFTIVALGIVFLAVLGMLIYAAVRHRGAHVAAYDALYRRDDRLAGSGRGSNKA